MQLLSYSILILITVAAESAAQSIHESDLNFRVEPGSRTCFFEKGKAGHTMELFYQVLDGQHGDLDISFEVIDPDGKKILSDYKRAENTVIIELESNGGYEFCMDNSYSVMNSKLVFVYVLIEGQGNDKEAEVSVVDEGGVERRQEQVLQWVGAFEDGENYYIDVEDILNSLSRTLKHVVRARHQLDLCGAMKTRDSYLAFEDTFIVDIWSTFQISFMFGVGLLQVYMIKSLFDRSHKKIIGC